MRVVYESDKPKRIVCPKCKHLLEYNSTDITRYFKNDGYTIDTDSDFIVCCYCSQHIKLKT